MELWSGYNSYGSFNSSGVAVASFEKSNIQYESDGTMYDSGTFILRKLVISDKVGNEATYFVYPYYNEGKFTLYDVTDVTKTAIDTVTVTR